MTFDSRQSAKTKCKGKI